MNETNKLSILGRVTLTAYPAGLIGEIVRREAVGWQAASRIALESNEALFRETSRNLVVSSGKKLIANLLLGSENTGLLYQAIGTNGTLPTAADTALGAETYRSLYSSTSYASGIITLSTFILAANCSIVVAEGGIFGGSGATSAINTGTLFSHYLQSYDNSGGGADLTFDYELTLE